MGRFQTSKPMSKAEWNAYNVRLYAASQRRLNIQRLRAAQGIHIKVCRKCDEERPLTDTWFKRSASASDGFSFVCAECTSARLMKDRKKNHRRTFKRRKGYTQVERDAALRNATACVICRSRKNLVVDHCHENKKMRGVLCNECNAGIGKLDDNPDLLERAAAYLRGYGHHRSGERRAVARAKKFRALADVLRAKVSAA